MNVKKLTILKKTASFIFYVGAVLFAVFLLYLVIDPGSVVGPGAILLLSLAICGALYLGALLRAGTLDDPDKRRKTVRVTLWIMFIYYAAVLACLLFFASAFGRGLPTINGSIDSSYLRMKTNFIPFKTIAGYCSDLLHGNPNIFIVDILGNIAAFAPMAFFIPILFPKFKSARKFLILMAIIIVFVEGAQLLFAVGFCDVDDLILNLSGAAATFFILKLKRFQNMLMKLESQK